MDEVAQAEQGSARLPARPRPARDLTRRIAAALEGPARRSESGRSAARYRARIAEMVRNQGCRSGLHSVRPGITGLWQVSGHSGTTYEHRVELDCRYVQELSLANDLRILWRTAGAVLRQDGAC